MTFKFGYSWLCQTYQKHTNVQVVHRDQVVCTTQQNSEAKVPLKF
jgi:hypothetical protein